MDNKKKEVVEALSDCYGIVTDACRKAKVARSTFYNWMKEDAEFKAEVDDITEEAIDFVEGKLFEKINGVTLGKYDKESGELITYDVPPSDTAIIFYLKTKAKKRGYVERHEIAGVEGRPLVWKEERTYQTKENGVLNGIETK